MQNTIISKMVSGRFIFTIISSVVFAYLACTGKMEAQDAEKIIMVVVYAYFSRNDRKKEGVDND